MSTQGRAEDLLKQLSSLSPEKRALLALRLRKKGGEFNSFPLSFAQERLWFLDQLEPGNSAYNVPAALRLRGSLDVEALRRTLDEVVSRHEILRTTFAVVDGKPVQVVAPQAAPRLSVADLGHLPEAEREAESRRLASVEAQEPFDLARGPLLRTSLLRLGEDDHVLLFTLHHIVSDGWSMSILVSEVAQLYDAFARGAASPLRELPIQYADFAVWQRGHLKGAVLEEQLAYWRAQLAGAPPVLELPTDRPRPAVQTFRGAKYQFKLPAELTAKLKSLARSEGATVYMTLLAAFQVLLARYSGQEDIVVGSPIANRNRAETEGLIGFFVNTLVMRADLSDNPTFTELLGRVRETALGAYAHQDLPFEKLVEELQPERNTARAPIFQVMFALQNAPQAVLTLPHLTLAALEVENHTTHFDLGVSLNEGEDALSGVVEYNTDLFDPATVARLMRHFVRLLTGVAADPSRRVSELQLLDEEELHLLLERWGANEDTADAHATVLELFEEQAARTPDAVALMFGDERMNYAELNARADGLARRLRSLGVGAETRVGVLLERSPEIVVALFAIFKAGGAYVPLDPQYPRERIAFMLEDARVAVLLTQSQLAESLPPGVAAQVISLDREWEDTKRAVDAHASEDAASDPRRNAAPDALAYLIYTSGTTGRPKAVMVEHRQLAHTLLSARRHFSFSASDVMPVLASYAFDIWLFETLSPLLAGGTSLLMRHDEVLDVAQLVGEMRRCGATVLHAVPSLMRQIVAQLGEEGGNAGVGPLPEGVVIRGHVPGRLPLRMVFVGGDAVGADLLREMRGVFPDSDLRVLYGPTETAIICTAHAVKKNADSLQSSTRQLIGRPLAGVRIRVLDAHRQVVPVGVAGEIHIGGEGVSRGYLNRDELTAEKFVEIDGERYYRSGDVGRWVEGGEIEFLGRVDEQVKVRGFRVELGEIEAVVSSHARVREAAVVAQTGAGGEKRLVAYVVLRTGEGEGAEGAEGKQREERGKRSRELEQLREHARERLPEYMVPAQWVEMEELPLTAHGKVDKRRLPRAEAERPDLLREFVAPQTELEQLIANVWAEALGVERVGSNDNFFELGGHSLLAIQVHRKLRERLAREISIVDLFTYPTVHSLASFLGRAEEATETFERVKDRAEKQKKAKGEKVKKMKRGKLK
ncbi:MAG TPA: amino acid adenylation domain-containing protein [Pyrinomonadaceae bacterium]|nr:amino acid adenylation domain-containing protein [Pyrinomonadaceae bacterium]